jgi:hypothetical protein
MSSSAVSAGSFLTTNSFTASPELASGIPTQAHSRTPGMIHHHGFDFVREYIEAGHQNHIFLTIDDFHKAARIHHADIAERKNPSAVMTLAVSSGRFQ